MAKMGKERNDLHLWYWNIPGNGRRELLVEDQPRRLKLRNGKSRFAEGIFHPEQTGAVRMPKIDGAIGPVRIFFNFDLLKRFLGRLQGCSQFFESRIRQEQMMVPEATRIA